MALPFAAAIGGYATSGAVSVLDNALGRPFELWTAIAQAENAGRLRIPTQRANQRNPWGLPTVDAIFKAWRCGLLNSVVAAEALSAEGVCPPPDMLAAMPDAIRASLSSLWGGDERFPQYYGRLWANTAYMSMSRPDAGSISHLDARFRIGDADRTILRHGIDASWDRYAIIANAQYEMPSYTDLRSHWALGRMDDANYQRWAKRLGWLNDPARTLAETISSPPSVSEVLLANYRGRISPARLRQYGLALGYVADEDWNIVVNANRPMPGVQDIIRFAVKDVWDEEAVRAFGYDDDFPAPFAAWMRYQGADWGEAITAPDGTRVPLLNWPRAYWRAHWATMSPSQAYEAYRRLRPNRIGRYQELSPGVEPFTEGLLDTVLKVADYPPRVRKWLKATSFSALDIRVVRQAFQFRLRDRAWMIEQMLDRGVVLDDAETWADVEEKRREQYESPIGRSLNIGIGRALFRETMSGYHDGLLTRDQSRANLVNLGATQANAESYMQLADARFLHENATAVIRALRSQYLKGQVSELELPAYFSQAGLTPESAARYVRRWRLERTLERRSLSSGQVVAQLGAGAISAPVALVRLANLGWANADAALLVQQGLAKLAQAEARGIARLAKERSRLQRDQVRTLKQSERAAQSLRSQLRSITPLNTLKKWLLLGIRSVQWVRQRMLLIGYDTTSIDAYLSEWVREDENKRAGKIPPEPAPARILKRQTSVGSIKLWWQNGVVTDSWSRQRLAALGHTPESIHLLIEGWRSTLGKKPGPADEPTPEPTAGIAPATTGARALQTAPRTLETTPRNLGAQP